MGQKFEYQDQIQKLHTDLRNCQDELTKVVEEKQVTLAHKAVAEQALMEARAQLQEKRITDETTCKMHKYLLMKAEKDRDKCKEEKRKLDNYISDLLNKKEDMSSRFKKIKDLCDV
jgi:CRISPR/Cas system-associated endonuclease Cas3-HD